MGAGIGTGLAGMSAAVVITPMLVIFLKMEAYSAIGIALASDVIASAVSAITYGKHKKIDIKHSTVMLCSVLLFTVLFSYISSLIPHSTLGFISILGTLILGLKFIISPVTSNKVTVLNNTKSKRIALSILCGGVVGAICGFVGAGGGIMMLILLTAVLGYELKTAVGTSVFIMTFTALTGSVSRFAFEGLPDFKVLCICALSTLVWAELASLFANKAPAKILNRTLGAFLLVFGAVMMVFQILEHGIF
jgi:uncharacterized membrane protein YfcA